MPKILVADDNTNIQKMVTLALQERGIEVVAVGNGEAAVRRLPELKPDMVLADIFMPVRNGYEVCEYIKKDSRFAQIPVILLLGAFDPLDEKEARRVGADGVLKKPFIPPDPLIAMVTSVLEKNPAVAAEMQKKKKPAADAAAKPAVAAPMKPLSRLSQMISDVSELVPGAPVASVKPAAAPSPPPAEPEDDFATTVTAPDWRRSAMDFEISREDSGNSGFLADEVAGGMLSVEAAAESKKEQATFGASSVEVSEPEAFRLPEPVTKRDEPAKTLLPIGSEQSNVVEIFKAAQEVQAKAEQAAEHVEAMPDTSPEFIEATVVSEAHPEEQATYQVPVVEKDRWQPPASVETEHDDATVTSDEQRHQPIPFYDPPPRDVPVAEVTLEEDAATISAADTRSASRIPPPVHTRELGHEDVIEAPIAQSLNEPAVPEPTFSSRMRGWMETIAPSGTPEGGWLASVSDVLSGTQQSSETVSGSSSGNASSIVAEPPAAGPTFSETVSASAPPSATPTTDEPFFLDEPATQAVPRLEETQQFPEAKFEAAEEAAVPVAQVTDQADVAAPVIAEAEQSVSAAEESSAAGELPKSPEDEPQVAGYQEPGLIGPVSVALKPEPLLVKQEEEDAKLSTTYGAAAQEVPPLYTFLEARPEEPAVVAAGNEGAGNEPSVEEAAGSIPEATSGVPVAEPEFAMPVQEENEPHAASETIAWSTEAQVMAQLPAEAPLPEKSETTHLEEVFAAAPAVAEFETAQERTWFPTAPPPNLEALAEIPFLTPSREFLAGNAEKSWTAPVIASQQQQEEHAQGAREDAPELTPKAAETAPSTEIHTSTETADAKDAAVDEMVRKVLDRLEPRLHELLKQGLLKPLVESILHEESERK